MLKALLLFFVLSLMMPAANATSREKTAANIVGHVIGEGEHLPFVNISVKGTTIGTLTDETGHFYLFHLPVDEVVIAAHYVGYKPKEIKISPEANVTKELTFVLEPDVLGLEEVVVTGDRNARKRSESPVIVNSIQSGLFTATQSATMSESLNYTPGLRLENNCQNCGFTQVRMNGMEGSYSQILINSRPIFSGLAGVYGLELIPANMIDRIEVVRGGGSAVYGSNAIAGTINLILKDPLTNSYELGFNSNLSGVGFSGSEGPTPDHTAQFNASMVSSDYRTGLAIYGFYRDRGSFDANNDGFSEITTLNNSTLGSRFFQRFGNRGKMAVDFFNIREDRRGGNRFEYPLHEADIAEAVTHQITTAAVTYEHFTRDYDLLSVFFSGQHVDRDSYYGANRSLDGYGHTTDFSYNTGLQYKALMGSSTLTGGLEYTGGLLKDKKLGYPEWHESQNGGTSGPTHVENTIVSHQSASNAGAFAQYDFQWNRLLVSFGGRVDHYRIEDLEKQFDTKQGTVFSPRLNLLYNFSPSLHGRLSYSKGYRAPQIYDEDLHIESSGSRRVIHVNAPDLQEETSRSFMASAEWIRQWGTSNLRVLAEGFYTRLNNPFANEYGLPDEEGTVVYTRINADGGARVRGVNTEMNLVTGNRINLTAGFSFQSNRYDQEQEFGETRFLRTPGSHGFMSIGKEFPNNWEMAATATYTGEMLLPYFGPALSVPEEGELRTSKTFFDLGFRLQKQLTVGTSDLKIFAGVKNLLNAYQGDFDFGIERDPGYMYGPAQPRTIYMGVKIGSRAGHQSS